MKIDQSVKKNADLTVGTPSRASNKVAVQAQAEKVADTSDSVTLSPEAQAMGAQSSDKEVFNSAKVTEIKAAIANGTFQVNANRIADGLIDTVKDLISARKG